MISTAHLIEEKMQQRITTKSNIRRVKNITPEHKIHFGLNSY